MSILYNQTVYVPSCRALPLVEDGSFRHFKPLFRSWTALQELVLFLMSSTVMRLFEAAVVFQVGSEEIGVGKMSKLQTS